MLCARYMQGCGDGGEDLQKKLKGLSWNNVLCLNTLTHTGCIRKTRDEGSSSSITSVHFVTVTIGIISIPTWCVSLRTEQTRRGVI